MTRDDITALTHRWLEQRQIRDLDPSSPWLQGISRKTFSADEYLVLAGDLDDSMYIL